MIYSFVLVSLIFSRRGEKEAKNCTAQYSTICLYSLKMYSVGYAFGQLHLILCIAVTTFGDARSLLSILTSECSF